MSTMQLLNLSFVHEKTIATLETHVRALEKYCQDYQDVIARYQQIVTERNTTIEKLLKNYGELTEWVKDRTAQDRARVDAINAHLKTQAADDATETAA